MSTFISQTPIDPGVALKHALPDRVDAAARQEVLTELQTKGATTEEEIRGVLRGLLSEICEPREIAYAAEELAKMFEGKDIFS